MSDFRAVRTLIYGFRGAAQFQIVAGDTFGLKPDWVERARSVAAGAAADAATTGFPAGRSSRRGSVTCSVLALPTTAPETLSGRHGLAISFVIIRKGRRHAPTDALLHVLAALEISVLRALPAADDLRTGAQELGWALQREDGGAAVVDMLAALVDNANRVLDAVAGAGRSPRSVAPTLPFEVLATLAAGARSTRNDQQCLVVRLGDPAPVMSRARAHHFLHDLVVVSQDTSGGQ